jgi:NADH:ubiquinone oxidoreductase subunit F (NADH-binding)
VYKANALEGILIKKVAFEAIAMYKFCKAELFKEAGVSY